MRKWNKWKHGAKCLVRILVFQICLYCCYFCNGRKEASLMVFFDILRNLCKRSYCSESGVQEDKSESETAVIHDFYVEQLYSSRNCSEVRPAVPSVWTAGRRPVMWCGPSPSSATCPSCDGLRTSQSIPLQEEDTVSFAIVAAGWWLLGACHHTLHNMCHPPGRSGSETPSCPGFPSSWSTPRGGLQEGMFTCFQNHAMLLQSNPATLDPSGDGDIWQQGWMSDGERYHHNHLNQTQDVCCWAGCWGCPSKTAQWHSCTSVHMSLCNAAAERPPPPLLLVRDPGSHSSATIAILQSKKIPRLSQVRLCPGLPLPDGAVNAPLKYHRNSWREGKETSNTPPANKSPAPHQWCWNVPWNMAKAG